MALARSDEIQAESLPPSLLGETTSQIATTIPPQGVELEVLLGDYERALLLEALRHTKGVKKRAAQLLRISFRSFRYRLEKLGLDAAGSSEP